MLRPLALLLGLATAAVLVAGVGRGSAPATDLEPAAPRRLVPASAEPPADGAHAFTATRRDGTDRPALWDPCRPVTFAVRRAGELPGGDAALESAAREVARASGLALVRGPDVTGPLPDTDDLALRDAAGAFPPALIAWSSPQERPELAGGTLALGGATVWAPPGRPGQERLVGGLVALDGPELAALLAGPDGTDRLRGVLLHELAHLVGLDHVEDAAQLLHPTSAGTGFATGDLRGLHAAGQGQCFQDW